MILDSFSQSLDFQLYRQRISAILNKCFVGVIATARYYMYTGLSERTTNSVVKIIVVIVVDVDMLVNSLLLIHFPAAGTAVLRSTSFKKNLSPTNIYGIFYGTYRSIIED